MSNKNNPIAIIDIGSSSVRLGIFDEQNFSASVIFNEKVTLNLGKGIFMKRIGESELQNLIQVLKRFFHLCKNVKKKNLHIWRWRCCSFNNNRTKENASFKNFFI